MDTIKSLFTAKATGERNGHTEASDGSVRAGLSVPSCFLDRTISLAKFRTRSRSPNSGSSSMSADTLPPATRKNQSQNFTRAVSFCSRKLTKTRCETGLSSLFSRSDIGYLRCASANSRRFAF